MKRNIFRPVLLISFLLCGLVQICIPLTSVAVTDQFKSESQRLSRWLENNRDPRTGLPYSHVGDKRFEQWAITYDAALTTLAYISINEIEPAARIMDFYLQTPKVWRLGGVIEAYLTGEVIRSQDWTVRSGANIWLALASYHLYKVTNIKTYLNFSEKIAATVLALQNKSEDDPNHGGIPLGPPGSSENPGDQHFGYDTDKPSFHTVFSSEVTIDAYALFSFLYAETQEEKYLRSKELCLVWLKNNAYQPGRSYLFRGYHDSVVASDVQHWAISAMGPEILNEIEADLPFKMIKFVEDHCVHEIEYVNNDSKTVTIRGVDFIDKKRAEDIGRSVMVSPEWTFQLANAYLRLEQYQAKKKKWRDVNALMQKRTGLLREMLKLAIENEGGLAYPYATLADAPIGHEFHTPKQGTLSTSGVAYGIMALQGFDPLAPHEE
ncbi:MAG: hypothetical protein K8S27_09015 [Candidatus Omnitrophica bacterium]|nr:hypothetical protein [Candidatus Omnitrophota bacterium]